jgi:hypothetical protein
MFLAICDEWLVHTLVETAYLRIRRLGVGKTSAHC